MPKEKFKLVTNPGEEEEKQYSGFMLRERREKRAPFYMLFYEPYNDLILNEELAGADIKFLHLMASAMTHDNVCELSILNIADALNITRAVGSRAVKRLQAIHAIHPVAHKGRTKFYMINPNLVSKTKTSHHKILIRKWNILMGLETPKLELAKDSLQTQKELNKGVSKAKSKNLIEDDNQNILPG